MKNFQCLVYKHYDFEKGIFCAFGLVYLVTMGFESCYCCFKLGIQCHVLIGFETPMIQLLFTKAVDKSVKFQTNEVTTDWLSILLEIAFVNRFSEQ